MGSDQTEVERLCSRIDNLELINCQLGGAYEEISKVATALRLEVEELQTAYETLDGVCDRKEEAIASKLADISTLENMVITSASLIGKQKMGLHDIYEVYAGSKLPVLMGPMEKHLYKLIKQMADIAGKHK